MQLTLLMRTLVTCAPLESPLFPLAGAVPAAGAVPVAGAVPPEPAIAGAGKPPASRQSSAPVTAATKNVRCL